MPLVSSVMLLGFGPSFQKLRIDCCLLGEELLLAGELFSAVSSDSVLAGGWHDATEDCGGGREEAAFLWKAGAPGLEG